MASLHSATRLRALAPLLAAVLVALAASVAGAGPLDPCEGTGDTDGDGICDRLDNCINVANAFPMNCDADQDGYGNACDGDYDNGGTVAAGDFTGRFLPCFAAPPYCPDADHDCGGTVAAPDFTIYFIPQFIQGFPGPSGWSCAGTVPCLTP